jgi:hypothetical protein
MSPSGGQLWFAGKIQSKMKPKTQIGQAGSGWSGSGSLIRRRNIQTRFPTCAKPYKSLPHDFFILHLTIPVVIYWSNHWPWVFRGLHSRSPLHYLRAARGTVYCTVYCNIYLYIRSHWKFHRHNKAGSLFQVSGFQSHIISIFFF